VHDCTAYDCIRENGKPVFRRTVGRNHDRAFREAFVGKGVQKLGLLLAIQPECQVVEDQKSRIDASFHKQLAALRGETVGGQPLEELVGLKDHDVQSAASGLMAYSLCNVRLANSRGPASTRLRC